jgi:hypothetical protein
MNAPLFLRQSHTLALQCLLAVMLAGSSASAEAIKRADLCGDAGAGDAYYVVICARKSAEWWGPGHAFVVWIRHDANEENVQANAFGFYPKAEQFGLAKLIGAGTVIDESTKEASIKPSLLTHRYVVRVDRDTFLASQQAKDKWADSKFKILRHNCAHFVQDVATRIGLDPPSPGLGESPPAYLARLIAAPPTRPMVTTPSERIAARPSESVSSSSARSRRVHIPKPR